MSSTHEKRLEQYAASEDKLYVTALKKLLMRGKSQNSITKQNNDDDRLQLIWNYLNDHERPDSRHTVHIAGSKGKGSTASIVEIILRFAGANTCLLTSPDLHSARECILLYGQLSSYPVFIRLGY